MAKAIPGGVVLELTANEAKVIHALVGDVGSGGVYPDEFDAIYDALESVGVESTGLRVQAGPEGVVLSRVEC